MVNIQSLLQLRANTSGNGITSFSYGFTPDSATFSEEKVNESIIKEVINSGEIIGKAKLKSGTDASMAYAKGYGDGNGISSIAFTSNFAKHNTKSEIGKVNNTGKIMGEAEFVAGNNKYVSFHEYADAHGEISGNGISSYSRNSNYQSKASDAIIGEVINTGTISGKVYVAAGGSRSQAEVKSKSSGNGISVYAEGTKVRSSTLGNVTNLGIISGYASTKGGIGKDPGSFPVIQTNTDIEASGNGISVQTKDQYGYSFMGDIENTGVIRGYSENIVGKQNGRDSRIISLMNGNGIAVKNKITSEITNIGVISGNNNAITMASKNSYNLEKFEGTLNNYGILAGQKIIANTYSGGYYGIQSKDVTPSTENNRGIYITLDETGNVNSIKNGIGKKITLNNKDYTVLNSSISTSGKDSETLIDTDKKYSNTIINGAGIENGTINLKAKLELENSVVNALNTAIKLQDNSELTAINTVFNGGGLKGDKVVILGDEGDNILNLKNSSVVNGDINLGKGNDILNIDGSVVLNGEISGGTGDDILNLGFENTIDKLKDTESKNISRARRASNYLTGSTESKPIKIDGTIEGFKTLNINTDVTFGEKAKLIGTENLNIEKTLTLKVDPTKKDENGAVIGHALYSSSSTKELNISGDGILNIKAASLEARTLISLGASDVKLGKNIKLSTNSIIQGARLTKNGNILVTVTELPEVIALNNKLTYKQLDDVYQSYITDWKYTGINGLEKTVSTDNQTSEEAKTALYSYFNQVYANNIYGYGPSLSRDSVKLYENAILDLADNVEDGEWQIDVAGIYSTKNHTRNEDYIGAIDDSASTNTGGLLASGMYGISETKSLGLTLAGAQQNTELDGESKLDADSIYAGIEGIYSVGNWRSINGLGYQRNSYEGTRVVNNGQTRHEFNQDFNTDTFNIFTQLQYEMAFKDHWALLPKVKLAYSYVSQDGIEEDGIMGMNISQENFGIGDVTLGLDVKKTTNLKNSILELTGEIAYSTTFGDVEKDLIGKFNHGNEFTVEGAKTSSENLTLGLNLTLKKENRFNSTKWNRL